MESTIKSASNIFTVCTLLGMGALGMVSAATLLWVALL